MSFELCSKCKNYEFSLKKDIIFFYPPILLFIGLGGLLFGGDKGKNKRIRKRMKN